MKKITRILAVAVGVSAALSFAGCQTETVPEGRVGIEFWYEADINTNPTFYELVRTYNDTQGAEDGVYVSPSMINGIGDERNTYEGSCDASVVMITNDEVFKGFAVDGLFVDMSDYLAESNFDTSDIPEAVLNSCRLTVGGETKFACVDGPDFDGHLVDFDEAMKRGGTYRDFEAHAREEYCNLLNKEVQ